MGLYIAWCEIKRERIPDGVNGEEKGLAITILFEADLEFEPRKNPRHP